jgi:glutamine---fructose-6-phosphate transaminase (isomerizing)
MRREIEAIPSVTARLLDDGARGIEAAAGAARKARPRFAMIVARGTSDNAGIYARYLIESHLGWPTGLAASSLTTIYRAPIDWRDVLLIAISQSGAGPDILEVTETARRGGALTVAVTNTPQSALAGAAELVLDCRAGVERSVAATKTYVAELTLLAALVSRIQEDDGLARALTGIPAALAAVLGKAAAWIDSNDELIAELSGGDRSLVVSRGYNLATALEVALKLKETAHIFADGYSSADLLHGPIVLAGPGIPLLVMRPDGPMGAAIDGTVAGARRSGARPWLIGGAEVDGRERALLIARELPEALTPLAYVLPGQLLAEAVARARGFDPDSPEGLSKVTLTR